MGVHSIMVEGVSDVLFSFFALEESFKSSSASCVSNDDDASNREGKCCLMD